MASTVLITGGAKGIGAATVRLFSSKGFRVILHYNTSKAQAEALQAELNASGGDVHLFQADLSVEEQVAAMAAFVGEYFHSLEVLVNNAGQSVVGTIEQVNSTELNRLFNVNTVSAYNCCRYFLPLLKRAEKPHVVNVSSMWGYKGASCEVAYSITKFGIIGLTKSLAEEWSSIPIKVNCVCPPIVLTDMCAHLSSMDVDLFCRYNLCQVYTPAMVASDIYKMATAGRSGMVIKER